MKLEQGRALESHRVVEVGRDLKTPFGPTQLFQEGLHGSRT